MSRTYFTINLEIPVPPPLVWSVMADVERWPQWTPSITRVKVVSLGALQIGSHVRIHQPKLPPALWRVTELSPGAGFTWVSCAPGLRVTARHIIESIANGTRATLSIQYEGLLGKFLARLTGGLNERYLSLEANGLRTRCLNHPSRPNSEFYETH